MLDRQLLFFVVTVFGTIGSTLCLAAMFTYDWGAARSAASRRPTLPWRVPFLSPRGRRWMAIGFPMAVPWWVWGLVRMVG